MKMVILLLVLIAMTAVAMTFAILYFQPQNPVAQKISNFLWKPKTIAPINTSKNVIDHVFYINLDLRTDRKYQIESELKRLGFDESQFTRVSGVVDVFSSLGCSRAHAIALKLAQEKKCKFPLIIEDDALFESKEMVLQSLHKINQLQINWDVLMFGGVVHKYERTDVDFLLKVLDAQTTCAYSVSSTFLPVLIKNVEDGIKHLELCSKSTHDFCIDIYWKILQPKSNWYIFNPLLVHQRESYSDIEQKITKYNDDIKFIDVAKNYQFLVCVKTCKPRLGKNIKQLEILTEMHKKYPMNYLYYLGNENLKNDHFYDINNHVVILKTGDTYLDLCAKVGSMFRFLMNYLTLNENCANVRSVIFTDDDCDISKDLYNFVQDKLEFSYWGKPVTYPKGLNLSDHIIKKAQESPSLKELCDKKYPDLLKYKIKVNPIVFSPGGCFGLSRETIFNLATMLDRFFVQFPQSNDLLREHLINCEYFDNLHIFDDVDIAQSLNELNIQLTPIETSSIVSW